MGTSEQTVVSGVGAALANDPGLSVTLLGSLPIGLSQGDILAGATAIVEPLLQDAVPGVLPELLGVFGARLGGADVTVLWVETQRPSLMR